MGKVKLNDWLDYLKSRVNIDLYVWGANGQPLVDILNNLREMEKTSNDLDRTLTLLQKRLRANVNIYDICCEDCSGLGIKFLLTNKVVPNDMTANGLYDYIVGNKEKGISAHGKKISISEIKAGDYVFKGGDSNKTHIGYAIDSEYAIESQDHDVGVVKTKISERPWGYAARPDWYEEERYVLTRELYYTNPMMRGEDVEEVQSRLTELKYDCGDIDGIFGDKTAKAVTKFQNGAGLEVKRSGVVGKRTAQALGFIWEG